MNRPFFALVQNCAKSFFKFRPLRRPITTATEALSAQYGEITDSATGKTYKFHVPNPVTLFRVETFFEKEPETLEWISSFEPNSIFFDIGANVGTYSVYAAVNNKAKSIYSFEPESQNYSLLNRNLFLNQCDDRVTALNIALNSEEKIDVLHLSSMQAGSAVHNFGKSVDQDLKLRESPFRQGAISFSLDHLIAQFNLPIPQYIKLDVDGLESEIIKGAAGTLKNPSCRSILIEINEKLEKDQSIARQIASFGFKLEKKAHSKMFDAGPYSSIYNYIFTKQSV